MWDELSNIAMQALSFLVFILFIAGVLGGLAYWVEKSRERRDLMEYMKREKMKADMKS